MAIAPQLDGTIEFLLGQITWTIVNPDKHFLYNKKGELGVSVFDWQNSWENTRRHQHSCCQGNEGSYLCMVHCCDPLLDVGLHPCQVTQSDSLGTQSTNTGTFQAWRAVEDVGSEQSIQQLFQPVCFTSVVLTSAHVSELWQLDSQGHMGLSDLSRCHMSEEFSFPSIALGPSIFPL